MLTFLFLLLYVTVPVLVYRLFSVGGFDPLKFSIASFVLISMFVSSYIGLLPLYMEWSDYALSVGVNDRVAVFEMYLMSAGAILGLTAGFTFARRIMGVGDRPSEDEDQRSLHRAEIVLLVVALVVCTLVTLVYLSRVPHIALLVAIAGNETEAAVARSLMNNAFSGRYHWYSVFMHEVVAFIALTSLAHWIVKRTRGAFLLFSVSLLLAVFTATMDNQKAPLAWLLVGLYLVTVIIRHRRKYFGGEWLRGGVIIVGALTVLYIVVMGADSILMAWGMIARRIFIGQLAPLYWYLEYFPAQHNFLLGRSFPNPAGLLPFEPISVTVAVMNWKFPELAASGVVGSAPTVFWGELYANVGAWGVMVVPFGVGVGLQALSVMLNQLRESPMKTGLLVWFALHYRTLATSGISNFVVDIYVVVVVCIFFGIYALGNRGRLGLRIAVRGASAGS